MRPKHFSIPNGLFFLSVHCAQGIKPFTNERACTTYLNVLKKKVVDLEIKLFGYVVMPDHVHLLLQQPEQMTLEKLMNHINGASAREINKQQNTVGEKFWQGGFHDVFLREAIDFAIKVNYIHNNPVKARLVVHPENNSFSSAKMYASKFGSSFLVVKDFDKYSLENIVKQINGIL